MPELEKKCYQLFGDENCDQELTHASQEDDGKGVALCGSCASKHRTDVGQPVRVLGTTDWVKPPPATIDPDEPAVGISGFTPREEVTEVQPAVFEAPQPEPAPAPQPVPAPVPEPVPVQQPVYPSDLPSIGNDASPETE